MEVTPVPAAGRLYIGGYGAGGFRIERQRYEGAILVHAGAVLPWSGKLEPDAFRPLAEIEPAIELLIIGTGPRFELVPPGLRLAIKELGLAVDAMATPAACRTYNVVTGDGRRAAAALLPVD